MLVLAVVGTVVQYNTLANTLAMGAFVNSISRRTSIIAGVTTAPNLPTLLVGV